MIVKAWHLNIQNRRHEYNVAYCTDEGEPMYEFRAFSVKEQAEAKALEMAARFSPPLSCYTDALNDL